MVLSPRLAGLGNAIEHRLAPPLYRHTKIITLSNSAKAEIVEQLHLKARQISVVPPGIDPAFGPGGPKADTPLVVAVGRLVPVKRFDAFIAAMVALKQRQPKLRAVIVGEGYERPALEAQITGARAGDWLTVPGRLPEDELVALYRRAWIVASTSVREGWGMTLTEAAACGTPAIATRISGHDEAVLDGESGLLVGGTEELTSAADAVLSDPMLRRRLSQGALRHAESLSWEVTAARTLEVLAAEIIEKRAPRQAR